MKCLLALAFALVHLAATAATNIQVFFSPNGGATAAITNELAKAKKTVLVAAYSFTSAPIAGALRDAHRRGVKVTVILDDSQKTANYSSADFLRNAGIATFTDGKHAIAHNKFMVLDGATVITGSFNFSKAAEESNSENLLVIRDADLASQYARNWGEHLKHSERYPGKPAKR
jgi:phosphatidylserine/phosphatidylglycerophosphate/cardiolipin synthase-like enzyme